MNTPHKALFVGLGGIGQRHLRNLRAILGDAVEIHAYRVRRQTLTLTSRLEIEAGANLEKKYRVHVHDTLEKALAIGPDIAFVCNPSSLHVPVSRAILEAGAHLFVEKPLSHDLSGIDDLIRIAEMKGLAGFVGYQMRFHPCLRRLEEIVRQGLLGRLLSARAEVGEYLPNWHKYEDYRQMYAAKASLGGGVILSQIHEMDYLYWLFGLPRRVFAAGGHLSSLEIDVEDVASSLFEFETDGKPLPVQLHQDYVQRPPSRGCSIVGDEGRAVVNLVDQSLQRYDANGHLAEDLSFADFERNQLFLDQTRHFLDCAAGRTTPLVSLRDGANSLRMALAVKHSLKTNQPVALADIA